jgi:hypothetical protein
MTHLALRPWRCRRLGDIQRTFPTALDLGSHSGHLARALAETGAGSVEHLYMLDDCGASRISRSYRCLDPYPS